MKALRAHQAHSTARREMAAFDSLPPELQDFIRTANKGWECSRLLQRFRGSQARKSARWGTERLMAQYRAEDAEPASIERAA